MSETIFGRGRKGGIERRERERVVVFTCSETRPAKMKDNESADERARREGIARGRARTRTNLDLAGGHLEIVGELLACDRARFLVDDEDALETLELGRRGALAGLDGVGDVVVEHLGVDLCGVDVVWDEGRNVGPVVVEGLSVEVALASVGHDSVEGDRLGRDDRLREEAVVGRCRAHCKGI